MCWTSVVVSSTGTSHEQSGMPCQDYGAFETLPRGVLIGAVSDGAGSARFADQAAIVSVRAALAFMKRRARELERASHEETRQSFECLVRTSGFLLRGMAGTWGCPLRDLACTLIAFMATPERLLATQIGDGFLVCRWSGGAIYELLFPPVHGEYVNETVFLIDPKASEKLQTGLWERPPEFICASTDGLEKLAIDGRKRKPFSPFFEYFDRFMPKIETPWDAEADLLRFLESERVNERIDDDKTLFLGFRESWGEEAA